MPASDPNIELNQVTVQSQNNGTQLTEQAHGQGTIFRSIEINMTSKLALACRLIRCH